jgi:hypothetical protein
MSGIYYCRYMAAGTTFRGKPFTREQTLTAAVWNGGDIPTEPSPNTPEGSRPNGNNPGGGGLVPPTVKGDDCCKAQIRLQYLMLVMLLIIAVLLALMLRR